MEKQKIKRIQIACVCLGLVLGALCQLLSGGHKMEENGNLLNRNSYGQGQAVYDLTAKGVLDEELPFRLTLEERAYTEKEAHKVYEKIMEELPSYILGENPSYLEVRKDLNLISSLGQYGVRLRWQSEHPALIDSSGTVHAQTVSEEGKMVALQVRMTDGNWPEEFAITVCVKPPLLTPEEEKKEAFLAMLKEEEETQRTEETFRLPAEFDGRKISYSDGESAPFFGPVFLGVLTALLLGVREKEKERKKKEARKQQLLLDYSEVVSRLIIFLGAGMSIRKAWDKIAQDYHRALENGKRLERAVYEEMYLTSCQLNTGVPESRAFAEFGRRCEVQQYMKLSGLLEQSRKNGSRHLREALRLEMAEAFELRKHQARRLGEEAGTKLLLPLFLMLAVVMVMIAVPALMEFQ
jgi:hypothetical protein